MEQEITEYMDDKITVPREENVEVLSYSFFGFPLSPTLPHPLSRKKIVLLPMK